MSRTIPLVNLAAEEIRRAVTDRYGQVATHPGDGFGFPVGRPFAEAIGYPIATLDRIPAMASGSFAGVTYFHHWTGTRPGDVVLDLGCGAGMDTLIAATMVAPDGRVIAVDASEAMVDLARANITRTGVLNVDVRQSIIEALPLPDAAVDVAQANGVFNLSPEKERAIAEVFRVLKPGGRLIAAEIVLTEAIPDVERATIDDWFR